MSKVVSIFQSQQASAEAYLAAIVDSSYDAIISKDMNGIITSWNPAATRLFGYSAEEAIGQSILMLIPEQLKAEEVDIISRVRRGERVDSFETMRLRKDGRALDISITVSPIKNTDGEIIGASKIARDISATKENERRIRLLMKEVNHRVKNQFAVILSMVRETLKRSSDPKELEDRIRNRLMALSRSHDLLVDTEWAGASLFDLIQGHLKPFGHDGLIKLSGPRVTLQANAVQYLGMAIHELGTNSAKYGALSRGVGSISVSWDVIIDKDGVQQLHLIWEETSVPDLDRGGAKTTGFGSVLLKRAAPDALSGSAVLDRSPGHVRWRLTAPVEAAIISTTMASSLDAGG